MPVPEKFDLTIKRPVQPRGEATVRQGGALNIEVRQVFPSPKNLARLRISAPHLGPHSVKVLNRSSPIKEIKTMRPALRGEEPAARDPVRGVGGR